MANITPGLKHVVVAPADTFCGMFLRKSPGGDLIPMARSYDGGDWEPAPGPRACPAEDVDATAVRLPLLEDSGDTYILLSKDGHMAARAQIAKFLEMTTFGPRMSEIDALDNGAWADDSVGLRARHLRRQMDLPATSHREYWRRRTNAKWDATSPSARSDHPCRPHSKWRRYSYTPLDRYDAEGDRKEEITTTFETVPEEAGRTVTIYETDASADVSDHGLGQFYSTPSSSEYYGYSGTGFYMFKVARSDFIQLEVQIPTAGTYPLSFRYASRRPGNWNRIDRCQLWVNGILVNDTYDFEQTGSINYWMYSELFDVALNAGTNTIELVATLGALIKIDHMRIGKPPAVVMKTNGWPRAIAKNGVHLLDGWPFVFTDATGSPLSFSFASYPDARQGNRKLYKNGRIQLLLPDGDRRLLDIGNPPVDFTGYEQYLPPNVITFTENDIFKETSSDLYPLPMVKGEELLLTNSLTDPICDSFPPFANEGDPPIFGQLPSGIYVQWTPIIVLENNGPSINDTARDLTNQVLSDGGGRISIQTGGKMKCSNTPRSFVNENTCFLSTEPTACSAVQADGSILIELTTSNVQIFYDLADRYVYAIRGLVMESLHEHACRKTWSRWEIQFNTTCPEPTQLEDGTKAALENAITFTTDRNEFTRDVTRTLACDSSDETTEKINIQLQVGLDCYTHVHPDHLNVYDFTGWVTNHPGGQYHIKKWAQGWGGNPGWYLDYPAHGNDSRGIPSHPMTRWYTHADTPDVVHVARLGNSISFIDLPDALKTDVLAQHFGVLPQTVADGGVVVCGSAGEVSNNPELRETFDVRNNIKSTSSSDQLTNQKQVVWTEIALYANDQLRQRMAWALAQIVTTVPDDIDGKERTEIYTNFYDIFVKHAFGNYRDILAEASYSPLMAEQLSYLKSKSHSYIYREKDKKHSNADENYAREVMQLFSIGLIHLNDDGTPILNPLTGIPLETYTNDDIESFARSWTGFDRTAVRGNYEESRTGTADNMLDPMRIIADWRDPFPKSNLNEGFIGDGYLLCQDLPSQSFLKKGASFRLLGGKSSPELMTDPSSFAEDANDILRVELDPISSLYQILHNGGTYNTLVELENDLICTPGTIECEVDTLRVVKVDTVYYEFVERPCIQLAFYGNGKQIQLSHNHFRGQMCANPNLPHARAACCREDRPGEIRRATTERGVTYLYEGERMTYVAAENRCVAFGRDLCLYSKIRRNDNWRGYHWTNRNCHINVKVNSEGYVAIVHDAISSYIDTIPYHVEEDNTQNWFRVFWNGGSYPGDSEANDCISNGCKTLPDGSCLCKTTVNDSVVFTEIGNVSKEDVIENLFFGAVGPQNGSTATVISDDLIVHIVGDNVDGNTVFEIHDKGRTMYLKNMMSTVNLEGWMMIPQIYEAEEAIISNAATRDNTDSATGGMYVEARYGDETSYVEWSVNVPITGKYLISLRYAHHNSPRPLSVFINGEVVVRQLANQNPIIPVDNIGRNPDSMIGRCGGDCDVDDHCDFGLHCHQNAGGAIPGCSGTTWRNWNYCVDLSDFDHGFTLLPTGGWTDDWLVSAPLKVNLVAGQNMIRVALPPSYTNGPNIDHLKIEGLPVSASTASFRNPPHFMGLIPSSDGEQNLRDAQYETAAVLDHYFYHDNVAPFMCIALMKRFSFSNPSPRFVASCVTAFRTGTYISGSEQFGSGDYGSLAATIAAILLDKEATNGAISSDPSFGSIREPVLKLMALMRSMQYTSGFANDNVQTSYNVKLWKIDQKLGQGPYEFPTVFSFFLPEHIPDSGPNLAASLTSPESMVVTMPNVINLLNGMFSLIKYGLSGCNGGFSTNPGFGDCYDNSLYQGSFGHLLYEPTGANDYEQAANLALLLTAGRLNEDNLNAIVDACSIKLDRKQRTQCMQQLIVTTGEFHTTSLVRRAKSPSDGSRDTTMGTTKRTIKGTKTGAINEHSAEPYKAIVYFYLAGGLDSYQMLAPHTCESVDVHGRYRTIRGKGALSEGLGLPLERLLEIPANNPNQPCSSFGIHENLPILKTLFDEGKLNFIANAGLLAKPVSVDNYRGETPVKLFSHNTMTHETKREDITQKFAGTGVGGRIADVLTQAGIPTNLFSINGQQIVLAGESGQGPSQYILSGDGLPAFNSEPSIQNMDLVIQNLNSNNVTSSGFHASTWSLKLSDSLAKHEVLKEKIDSSVVTTPFPPSGSTSQQFEMITRIMQTQEARGSKRDIFFVGDRGYDTHSNVDERLITNFSRINGVIEAFVNELVVLDLWESTVVVQFSEFARTLNPNTNDGSDHAWGGHHFMFGGAVNGGHVLGQYPSNFEPGDDAGLALSRGRMIPTTPWDALWKGTAEWFGIPANGPEMDKVLPMHKNFPQEMLFDEATLFGEPSSTSSSRPMSLFQVDGDPSSPSDRARMGIFEPSD